MCSLDIEACPVWNERIRAARKEHVCDCCDRQIARGDVYLAHSHVFDGSASSEKMCAICTIVRDDFAAAHGITPMPSDTIFQIHECIQGERSNAWRIHLAILLRRRLGTASHRKHLELMWARRAAQKRLVAS